MPLKITPLEEIRELRINNISSKCKFHIFPGSIEPEGSNDSGTPCSNIKIYKRFLKLNLDEPSLLAKRFPHYTGNLEARILFIEFLIL